MDPHLFFADPDPAVLLNVDRIQQLKKCGSRSTPGLWIPFNFNSWIRIRIKYVNPDPGGENLRERKEKLQGKKKKIVILL